MTALLPLSDEKDMALLINDPAIVAEVTAMFQSYEKALMENDLDQLDAAFWPSNLTVRIGVGEVLYGIDAIREFRRERPGGSPQRMLANTVITTYGRDFATAHTEFHRDGAARSGRQSQTWVRFPEGWRVVYAHVSLSQDGH